ncbi:MAG: peptidase U32, partial [Firmicutes bacterium HGW-Firmicutes-13]
GIRDYIKNLKHLEPDGLIVSDPSVIETAGEIAPDIPLHLSTQASATNWQAVKFWEKQGISRVVLARELSLEDIKEISGRVNIEIECFIHGAMCISYSGRCLLSAYLTSRNANLGECAHPCRWRYYLMEEKRPGEYHQVFEDEHGTHIFNSKDLCMINYIPELIQAGIDCFKVEGRMKSVHYVATVTRVYRQAVDEYFSNPDTYSIKKEWLEELEKVSHRPYTTGFFLGKPGMEDQIYQDSSYVRGYDFVGIVKEYCQNTGMALVEQRNHFARGEELEFLSPAEEPFSQTISEIYTADGEEVGEAPHPQQLLLIPAKKEVRPYDIIRRPVE